ncbi:NAD-dependent epimerase/dehydratase family protein [Dyella acidiphila]|uniref:NAD(P)H-binding protein n=1 Tax=Dyella acidiphila TaxID=2775866 RepID=A0ABR9G945_9GAMM|nr:NAD-dependent epimerase/dehydratase family protein [Dyella acidiphila]MBE1160542.1 NAD(P)H-binding protein [Dyella acidiphila]
MAERLLLAGCGDLGLRVAPLLVAAGHEVFALRRSPPAAQRDGIRWLQGDLTRPESLAQLPGGVTQLVYLPTPAGREEQAYRAIFLDGLRHVLQALQASLLQRVLFVSSSAVYGEHGDAWVDEDTPPAPPGFNGRVLLEAEHWLAAQPVRSVVLRLAGLYGPDRMQLVERIRAGNACAPRQPLHWANRMHVDDAAAAIVHLLALADPRDAYIGADDTPLPLHELYRSVAALIGAPVPPEGPAPAAVGSKRLSNARLRDSGFSLRWPDSRAGYAALLR